MTVPSDHSQEIERLVERAERDPRTHTFARLADLYRKAGELERALEVIEGGLQHHPHYLNARLVHARVLRELGRPGEARSAFEHVLRIDTENLVARAALAELEEETGRSWVAEGAPARPSAPDPGRRRSRPEESRGWLARLDDDWQRERATNGDRRTGPEAAAGSVEAPETTASSPESAPSPEAGAASSEEAEAGAAPSPGSSADAPDEPSASERLETPPTEPTGGATTPVPATEPGREAAGGATPARADTAGVDAADAGRPADEDREAPSTREDRGASDPSDEEEDDDGDRELETATLAALYARQGLFDRAIGIYERLLARDPYNARLAAALEEARRRTPPTDTGRGAVSERRRIPTPDTTASVAGAGSAAGSPAAEPSVSTDRTEAPARGRDGTDTKAADGSEPAIPIRDFLRALLDGRAPRRRREGPAPKEWPVWLARRAEGDE